MLLFILYWDRNFDYYINDREIKGTRKNVQSRDTGQYFILITLKKKSWTQRSWIFFNNKLILDYYICLKFGPVFLFTAQVGAKHQSIKYSIKFKLNILWFPWSTYTYTKKHISGLWKCYSNIILRTELKFWSYDPTWAVFQLYRGVTTFYMLDTYKCGHRNVLSKRQVWMSIFHTTKYNLIKVLRYQRDGQKP
jgi:hypothetical protein